MAIIRGKFFTLTPTSKVNIISDPGNRLTFTGAYSPPTITGGDETTITENNVTYKVHTFTTTGILTVTSAENNLAHVEYLVLAGGGGGGGNNTYGGGGGAGGYRIGTVSLNVETYTINVGAGGAISTNGEDSFIGNSPTGPYIILSNGGGAGGNASDSGSAGGSGGGGGGASQNVASGPGIPGQGFSGGFSGSGPLGPNSFAGGGGGAGSDGARGVPQSTGAGGLGVYNTFSGGSVYYAYGGPGGGGSSGPDNSGAGGGGNNTGGSGIVIIRYRI